MSAACSRTPHDTPPPLDRSTRLRSSQRPARKGIELVVGGQPPHVTSERSRQDARRVFLWRLVGRSRAVAVRDCDERELVRLRRGSGRSASPWQVELRHLWQRRPRDLLAVTNFVHRRARTLERWTTKQHGEQAHEHEEADEKDGDQQPGQLGRGPRTRLEQRRRSVADGRWLGEERWGNELTISE